MGREGNEGRKGEGRRRNEREGLGKGGDEGTRLKQEIGRERGESNE